MDEAHDPLIWMILAAIVGIALAFDRADAVRRVSYWHLQLILLAQAVLIAAADADSPSSFLYRLMMPIGCYKVARILATPLGDWWQARTRRQNQASGSKPTP